MKDNIRAMRQLFDLQAKNVPVTGGVQEEC